MHNSQIVALRPYIVSESTVPVLQMHWNGLSECLACRAMLSHLQKTRDTR
jgi:hypothetical protein